MAYSKQADAFSVQWTIRVSRETDRRAREYLQGSRRLGNFTDIAVAYYLGRAEERERLAQEREGDAQE